MHLSAMDSPIENCQEIDADEVHLLEVFTNGTCQPFIAFYFLFRRSFPIL